MKRIGSWSESVVLRLPLWAIRGITVFVALLALVFVVLIALFYLTSPHWAVVFVTLLVGAGLAYFAAAQARWAGAQLRHAEAMRYLGFAPVLAASFESDTEIKVKNVGQGAALDIGGAACRFNGSEDKPASLVFDFETEVSILGPGDETEITAWQYRTPRPGQASTKDVWIVHYADLNGNKWHTFSNWTRDDRYAQTEGFIFESYERTPRWVRDNCPRCR